jgi:dTDP-4-amino-4,6-dideoxygalactose transaminase
LVRYYDEGSIDMPADYLEGISRVEARVGLLQAGRYAEIVQRRRDSARTYDRLLAGIPALRLPAPNPGSTYSHYAVRVKDREALDQRCLRLGLQLGRVIDYCCPDMAAYRDRPGSRAGYPVASSLAREVINLPVYGGPRLAERASALLQRALNA